MKILKSKIAEAAKSKLSSNSKGYNSIYEVDTEKPVTFKLANDSSCIAFAVYLKDDLNNIKIAPE